MGDPAPFRCANKQGENYNISQVEEGRVLRFKGGRGMDHPHMSSLHIAPITLETSQLRVTEHLLKRTGVLAAP